MFLIAIFIGIYSYSIFMLGILGVLTKVNCILLTITFIILSLFIKRRRLVHYAGKYNLSLLKGIYKKPIFIFCILFIFQIIVNFLGALGPALAFDELWYHLTLSKLWLLHHQIFFIPGGLMYYSAMPKLAELLYAAALSFNIVALPQLIHFSFGLLICFAIYKIARKFLPSFTAFLAVVIFYSNIVVDWESTTAYIDLVRTFFEVMALWGFLMWSEKKSLRWFTASALTLGLAIMTKLLAIGSLAIFTVLFIYKFIDSYTYNHKGRSRHNLKSSVFTLFINLFAYWGIAWGVSLPWFIFSYLHTGNPVYPFFTPIYPVTPSHFSIISFFVDTWNLFIHADDPVSPVYLIFLPLTLWMFWKRKIGEKSEIKLIGLYSLFALIIWFFTPRTGGGRFIVPYLPAFSILCAITINELRNSKYLFVFLKGVIIFIALISLAYRGAATVKYLPVIFGRETQHEFLTKNLNFSFGDFYDTDNYFKNHITSTDVILLYGFHNLYYINFPFIDNSWVKKGDRFDYIAVQNTKLPPRFNTWQLIYKNDKTLVQLYAPPKGECFHLCEY